MTEDVRPSAEQIKEAIEEGWTPEDAAKGYAICDYDGTGLLEVTRIDSMMLFDSDDAACEQAAKDGIKMIPVEELPTHFDRRYFGWLDTPENRAAIDAYVKSNEAYRAQLHSKRHNIPCKKRHKR